jgi:hypothetical protein
VSLPSAFERTKAVEPTTCPFPLLRNGGLILTHDELENGDLIPTWTSVDAGSLYTLKESFNRLQDEGWTVLYYRTPISADRPIEVRVLYSRKDGRSETRSLGPFRTTTSTHTCLYCRRSIPLTPASYSTTVSERHVPPTL